MTLPEPPANATRQELRKALIQLRMELHRQEARQETLLALQPLQDVRRLGQRLKPVFGQRSAPLWGAGAAIGLGLLLAHRRQWQPWLELASRCAPLLLTLLQRASADKPAEGNENSKNSENG